MKTRIIAEFASSWNSDPDLMLAMVKTAAASGVDICKLQDWQAKNVPDTDSDKARYERYQMRDEIYPLFFEACADAGVEPLTSCFNAERVDFLAQLGFKRVKIASVCLTNRELLMRAGSAFEEVIVSTGMSTCEEVEEAADILASNCKEFTMLACRANYPTEPKDANLSQIDSLKKMLEGQEYASVGFSDHALDLDVAKSAMSKGIKYLEKHFSLSRDLPQIPHVMYEGGTPMTTHQISIEPHELKELARWRDKVSLMEGIGEFKPNEVEGKIRSRYLGRYGK